MGSHYISTSIVNFDNPPMGVPVWSWGGGGAHWVTILSSWEEGGVGKECSYRWGPDH